MIMSLDLMPRPFRLFDPFDLFVILPPSTPSTFNNRYLTLNTIYFGVYREGETGVNHPGSGR